MSKPDTTSISPLLRTCSSLYTRLTRLERLELSLDPFEEELEDPVEGIRDIFLLGTPLVSLYNLLPPHYPRIKLDLEVFADDEHSRRLSVALFAMNASQFLHCERFNWDDLKSDDGLQKAAQAVHLILDKCSEAGQAIEFVEIEHMTDNSRILGPPTRLLEQWEDWVRQTIQSEREYVEQIGVLEEYSMDPEIRASLGKEIVDYVFPRNFFTFMRKFSYSDGVYQNFTMAEDIGILYKIYCVNRILAQEKLQELKNSSLEFSKGHVTLLLDAPFKHLTAYLKRLETLISLSASLEHPHHLALVDARDAIERKLDSVAAAQEEAVTEQKVESLQTRIVDWKGLNPTNPSELGGFLHEGQLLVRKNDVFQLLYVFLFQQILMYCDEVLPEPSRKGKRKLSSASISNASDEAVVSRKLNIKGCIRTSRITKIRTSTMERMEGTRSKLYSVVTLVAGYETLALICQTAAQMSEWHRSLDYALESTTTIDITSPHPGFGPNNTPMAKALARVHLDDGTFMIALVHPVQFGELVTTIERRLRRLGRIRTRDTLVGMKAGDGSTVPITPGDDCGGLSSTDNVTELYVQS
ncbi:Guanine nucleotide exchange factor for Cdc42p [Marasmius tenuissimus]|uniref:Guanine nucleotide exchange factor for Cdc42p n=1 Tax=Marasmius tenuissimus TaxID=585030 RepID=A0ABR3A1Q9_9AGAR